MILYTLILIGVSAIAKSFADSIKFQASFPFRGDWWLGKGEYAWNNRTFWDKYIFSFASDGWHLFDFIRIVSVILLVALLFVETKKRKDELDYEKYEYVVDNNLWLMVLGLTVLGYIYHGIIFELTYLIL